MLDKPARFFLCGRCTRQVVICSDCDRGNRYCARGCAGQTRRELQREAGVRYQDSRVGRVKHAWRTRCWRQRKAQQAQSVTHQGSKDEVPDAVLMVCEPTVPTPAVMAATVPCTTSSIDVQVAPAFREVDPAVWQCQWCGNDCMARLRRGFLRHGSAHGHSP